ncbi:MAG: Mth938-like domain-containing protein [Sideroxydans sp.]
MALQLEQNTSYHTFSGHGPGYVAINGRRFEQALVVYRTELHLDWGAHDFATLTPAHFEYFLALRPEVVLVGTGARQHFARPELYRALIESGIAVEFMDTPAACRTYNILVGEERKVVAAVFPATA